MPRRLSRTEQLIQGQLPLHVTATVIPRGYYIPVDTFLNGEARFARRIGSVFPIISPENTMYLSKEAGQTADTIHVTALLPSVPVGSILSFRGKERHFVEDTVDTDETVSISITDTLFSSYAVNTPVYLHGVPVTVTADALLGATSISISSTCLVVLGDVLEVLATATVPGSAKEHVVAAITASDEEASPKTYTLTLGTGLAQALTTGDTLYLRAYPAYKSILLTLPTQETIYGENVGPFLWDLTEGRLHDGIDDPDVVLALETTSSAFYTLDSMDTVAKNAIHWRVPIPSSAFAFWDIGAGSISVVDGTTLLLPNSLGDALLYQHIQPTFQDVYWRATFETTADVTLRVGFHLAEEPTVAPSPGTGYSYDSDLRVYYREYALTTGTLHVVDLETPAGYLCDRIDIAYYTTDTTAEVKLREWAQDGGRSSWVQYTIMAPVNGDYTWASSGLIIKPMFYTTDHLKLIARLNSGAAMV